MNRSLPRLVTLLALGLLAAVGVVLAVLHPRFQFGTLVGDDAGYYLAIARNACLGHGFSFDRVHDTNGFNPLMPLLLIALDRVLAPGYDLVACFRIATLTTWVVLVLGAWPLKQLSARVLAAFAFPVAARPLASAALLLFYAGFLALKGYYGMDAFLVLTLGLTYLSRVAESGLLAPGARSALADGALLGCAVLARVDSLPLAVAASGVMLLRVRGRTGAWRALFARVATVAAIVGPYLLWNRLGFGDWLPISARLKSAFPHLDFASSLDTVLNSSLNRVDELALFAAFALAIAWLLAAVSGGLRPANAAPQSEPGAGHDAMLVFALYLAARIGWLLAFSRLDVQGSYFVLAHPFLALGLLVVAGRFAGSRGAQLAAGGLAIVAVILAAGKVATVVPDVRAIAAGQGDEWAIARRLHDAVGEHDVLYGGALGLVGYVADRPWVNGDGVANERGYQDAIRDHDLVGYLTRSGVTHVFVAASPPRQPGREPIALTITSGLHAVSDTLIVDPARIVLRERMRRNAGTELWLVRWSGAGGVQASPPLASEPRPSR